MLGGKNPKQKIQQVQYLQNFQGDNSLVLTSCKTKLYTST